MSSIFCWDNWRGDHWLPFLIVWSQCSPAYCYCFSVAGSWLIQHTSLEYFPWFTSTYKAYNIYDVCMHNRHAVHVVHVLMQCVKCKHIQCIHIIMHVHVCLQTCGLLPENEQKKVGGLLNVRTTSGWLQNALSLPIACPKSNTTPIDNKQHVAYAYNTYIVRAMHG